MPKPEIHSIELVKSPFMMLNSGLIESNQGYDYELDTYGGLGKKPFWVGPSNIGVGVKPHRKIISSRKSLSKS